MELYTGRTVKSTNFDYKYVGLPDAIDKEGPGFYFTTSIDTAFGYAGTDGIVIIAEVDTSKFLTKKNKPKLNHIKKLILSAPDAEDTLTNFAENHNKALNYAIKLYMDYDSALDSYQTICNDFYRHEPVKYLEQLIKLGFNGHFGEEFKGGQFVDKSQFIVVYNNKVIKVIDVKSSKGINESKKMVNNIIKESINIINEIGEISSNFYKLKKSKTNNSLIYSFKTESNLNYEIYFTRNNNGNKKYIWELAFGVLDEDGDINVYTITNKGEMYKVMSTILRSIKDFIKNNAKSISYILFEPGEKRGKMYIEYIKKNLPDWNLEIIGNEYYLSNKKNKINENVVHGLGYGLLQEIGDGSGNKFDFKLTNHSDLYAKYEFTTDQDTEYKVVFVNDKIDSSNNKDNWELSFGVNKEAFGQKYMSTDTETNKGEQYKVMSTIIDIFKDFINNYTNINSIRFNGTDQRRNNMYTKYVANQLGSDWKVRTADDGTFFLTPKNQSAAIVSESVKLINQLLKISKSTL